MGSFIFGAVGIIALIATIVGLRRCVFTKRRKGDSFIPTGLKAVDLFAPLPRGGDVVITGGEGTGSTVLGYELARRLLEHPQEDFRVFFYMDERLSDLEVRIAEMDDILPALTNRFTVKSISDDDIQQCLFESGSKHTVVFVASDGQRFLEIAREAVREAREDSSVADRLTIVMTNGCSHIPEFDARIACSRMVAKQGIYPAIDPYASHSSVYSDPRSHRRQKRAADESVKMIRKLMQTIYDGAAQDPEWIYNRDATNRPALQSLCFMSQAFLTAEAYTGVRASHVPIAETIDAFEAITSGKKSGISASRFMYTNTLPKE